MKRTKVICLVLLLGTVLVFGTLACGGGGGGGGGGGPSTWDNAVWDTGTWN